MFKVTLINDLILSILYKWKEEYAAILFTMIGIIAIKEQGIEKLNKYFFSFIYLFIYLFIYFFNARDDK